MRLKRHQSYRGSKTSHASDSSGRGMPVVGLKWTENRYLCGRIVCMHQAPSKLWLPVMPKPKKPSAADNRAQRHERHVQMQTQPRVYAKSLGESSLAGTSPWLERAQWLATYKSVRRDISKAMTTNPRTPWTDLYLGPGEREGTLTSSALANMRRRSPVS